MPSPSSIWRIQSALDSSTAISFSDLKASDVNISWRKQEISRCTFTVKQPVDSDPLFTFDQIYTVTKNSNKWFSCRCFAPIPQGDGNSESMQYELRDPWGDLEEIMFQQLWPTYDLDTNTTVLAAIPRYNFGQHQNGTRMTATEALIEILEWAISAGAFFQIGSIPTGPQIPIIAKCNMTCARAVQEMMRWLPDCALDFDHSVYPPRLNIIRRSACLPVTLSVDRATLNSLGLARMPELIPPCVCLSFEKTNTVNGVSNRETDVDIWPATGFTGAERRAVTATLELAGYRANSQKQTIKTVLNADDSSSGAYWFDWFSRFNPILNKFTPNNILFEVDSFYSEVDPGQKDENPASANYNNTINYDISDVNDTLVKGTIPDWLLARSATNKVCKATFGILISFNFESMDGATSDAEFELAKQMFGQFTGANGIWLEAHPIVTNIAAGTYVNTQSEGAEQAPVGLARWLHESLATPHYRSVSPIVLMEQECTGRVRLRNVANVVNGAAEWASMNAVVPAIEENLDRGRTSIELGPPAHLTPGDFLELLRASREAVTSTRIAERVSGNTDAATVTSDDPVGFNAENGGETANDNPLTGSFLPTEDSGTTGNITIGDGKLFTDINGTELDITDLATSFSVAAGDKVWIEVTVTRETDNSTIPGSAALKHGSSAWSGSPDRVAMDTGTPPVQKNLYIPIAEIVALSDPRDGLIIGTKSSPAKVISIWKQDIILALSNPGVNNGAGSAVWLAQPYFGKLSS